jgi:parallel beta-helix repeat protein
VVIRDASDPTLQTCKIRNGKMGGVLLLENAGGTFENCDISDNKFSGVWIRTGSNPTIRNTKINRNGGVAVLSEQNSAGSVLECDLTGNGRGAWSELAENQLSRKGNVE